MQTENGKPGWTMGSPQDWTGNLVFDRQGYLMGQVVDVDERPGGQFSLIVAPPQEDPERGHLTLDSQLLTEVNPHQREIHANVDYQHLISDKEQCFQLLEERLVVHRKRVKAGEVIIRKVIETEMVEVPIHREKLVVQKQGEDQSLFEMPLGEVHLRSPASNLLPEAAAPSDAYRAQGHLQSLQDAVRCLVVLARATNIDCQRIQVILFLGQQMGQQMGQPQPERVQFAFETPGTAANLLGAIAPSWSAMVREIRLDLFVSNPTNQARYQSWFDEYARVINNR